MIHLEHVTVRKQGNTILDDISLTLDAREHTAIIGPNGAGKSTLVRLISRDIHPLNQPQTIIEVFGRRNWNIFKLKSQLGIVSDLLQDVCKSTYRAGDIIVSGFFNSIGLVHTHAVTQAMLDKAHESASFMGVAHLMRNHMNRLSSGEIRRVLIARALVNNPRTLILDEPVTSLDMRAQAEFKQALRDIATNGTHIILVTHDLADIIPEMNRVVLLDRGRVAANGSKPEILQEDLLSEVYGTTIYIDQRNGWYKAWC